MQLGLDTVSVHVQLLVVTSIWKLINMNSKGRHVIKNSILFHKLNKLHLKMKRASVTAGPASGSNDEDDENLHDLVTAMEYVMKILTT